MRSRTLLTCVVCLVGASAPAAAVAQTPGDAQYSGVLPAAVTQTPPAEKPLVEPIQTPPAEEPAPQTEVKPAAAVSPARVVAAPATGKLPFTGLDLLLTLLASTALIGLGLALRTVGRRSPSVA